MRVLLILTGLAVLAGTALVEGRWTNRWTTAAAVQAAAARVRALPTRVGDWTGADEDMDPRVLEMTGAAGYVNRRYVHDRTSQVVHVFLMCGRPGRVAAHTPDVCVRGEGLELSADPARADVKVPGGTAAFLRVQARPEEGNTTAPPIEVYWSWTATGAWEVPAAPRFAFARYPVLYKLYVTSPLTGDEGAGETFLQAFLPEVQKCLFENP
jgi:hypothetical protein